MVSAEIVTEYREVLNRPKLKLTEAQKQRWFTIIEEATTLIDVNINVDFPRDSKDAKFIACALASGADFLIKERSRFYGGRRLGKNQGYVRFAI
jgi:putative PIN family toxin of toxin-antitoxin system